MTTTKTTTKTQVPDRVAPVTPVDPSMLCICADPPHDISSGGHTAGCLNARARNAELWRDTLQGQLRSPGSASWRDRALAAEAECQRREDEDQRKRRSKKRKSPDFTFPVAISISIEPADGDLVTFVFRERHHENDNFKTRLENTMAALLRLVPDAKALPDLGPLEVGFSGVVSRTQAVDMILSEFMPSSSLGKATFKELYLLAMAGAAGL